MSLFLSPRQDNEPPSLSGMDYSPLGNTPQQESWQNLYSPALPANQEWGRRRVSRLLRGERFDPYRERAVQPEEEEAASAFRPAYEGRKAELLSQMPIEGAGAYERYKSGVARRKWEQHLERELSNKVQTPEFWQEMGQRPARAKNLRDKILQQQLDLVRNTDVDEQGNILPENTWFLPRHNKLGEALDLSNRTWLGAASRLGGAVNKVLEAPQKAKEWVGEGVNEWGRQLRDRMQSPQEREATYQRAYQRELERVTHGRPADASLEQQQAAVKVAAEGQNEKTPFGVGGEVIGHVAGESAKMLIGAALGKVVENPMARNPQLANRLKMGFDIGVMQAVPGIVPYAPSTWGMAKPMGQLGAIKGALKGMWNSPKGVLNTLYGGLEGAVKDTTLLNMVTGGHLGDQYRMMREAGIPEDQIAGTAKLLHDIEGNEAQWGESILSGLTPEEQKNIGTLLDFAVLEALGKLAQHRVGRAGETEAMREWVQKKPIEKVWEGTPPGELGELRQMALRERRSRAGLPEGPTRERLGEIPPGAPLQGPENQLYRPTPMEKHGTLAERLQARRGKGWEWGKGLEPLEGEAQQGLVGGHGGPESGPVDPMSRARDAASRLPDEELQKRWTQLREAEKSIDPFAEGTENKTRNQSVSILRQALQEEMERRKFDTKGKDYGDWMAQGGPPPGAPIKIVKRTAGEALRARKESVVGTQGGAAGEAGPEPAPAKLKAPGGLQGREVEGRSPRDPNVKYKFRYRAVSLDEIVPSHRWVRMGAQVGLNPEYAKIKGLQPRERERKGLVQEAIERAQQHDADEALSDGGRIDTGSLIVGPDSAVESGNGRDLTFRYMRQYEPAKWNAYQKMFLERASEFGLDPSLVKGIKDAVLVRERISDVDRAEFADDANSHSTATYGPTETAQADAKRLGIDDVLQIQPSENGTLHEALSLDKNIELARRFLSSLPSADRTSLKDKNGDMNQQGIERLKAALFAKTYPGPAGNEMLGRIFEGLEDDAKNIRNAMLNAIPRLAKAESLMEDGARDPKLSIGEDIATVADKFINLKQRGKDVGKYLSEGVFGERELTPEQETILRYMESVSGSEPKMRAFIERYAFLVEVQPARGEQTLMPVDLATKQSLVDGAIKDVGGIVEKVPRAPKMLKARLKAQQAAPAFEQPAFQRKMYQGRGATPEEVYGKYAVESGRAVPLLGKGAYYADTRENAKAYGEVTEHEVVLKKPFVLDSDAKWFQLLKDANAGHLNNMAREFYDDPKGTPAATERLQKFLRDAGYDGVVVSLDETSDKTREINVMFEHNQVVRFENPTVPDVETLKPEERGTVPEEVPNGTVEPEAVGKKPAGKTAGERIRERRGESGGVPDSGVTDAGGNRGVPIPKRIITAREKVGAEKTHRSPDVNLMPHQQEGVALAEESIKRTGGFLLADGTGIGKTRQILTVSKNHLAKGGNVVIVAPSSVFGFDNRGEPSGSYADDAKALGMDVRKYEGGKLEGGKLYLASYNTFTGIPVTKDTLLVFDEAHSLKNRGARRTETALKMMEQVYGVLYASATPGDNYGNLDYLWRIGVFEGKTREQAYYDLGLVQRAKLGKTVWTPDQKRLGKGAERKVKENVKELFDRLTDAGRVVKREISMEGVKVEFLETKLPEEAHETLKSIERAFSASPTLNLTHQRLQQEPYKLAEVANMTKEAVEKGRQVVIVLTRVNPSDAVLRQKVTDPRTGEQTTVETLIASSGSSTEMVKKALSKLGIDDISELHGGATEEKPVAIEKFQSGKNRVVVATIQSGGVGINLDDRLGNRPRTMIIVTAPWDAVSNLQVVGRIWRLPTASYPEVKYVFADTGVDALNAKVLASKMRALGAITQGEAVKTLSQEGIEDVDVSKGMRREPAKIGPRTTTSPGEMEVKKVAKPEERVLSEEMQKEANAERVRREQGVLLHPEQVPVGEQQAPEKPLELPKDETPSLKPTPKPAPAPPKDETPSLKPTPKPAPAPPKVSPGTKPPAAAIPVVPPVKVNVVPNVTFNSNTAPMQGPSTGGLPHHRSYANLHQQMGIAPPEPPSPSAAMPIRDMPAPPKDIRKIPEILDFRTVKDYPGAKHMVDRLNLLENEANRLESHFFGLKKKFVSGITPAQSVPLTDALERLGRKGWADIDPLLVNDPVLRSLPKEHQEAFRTVAQVMMAVKDLGHQSQELKGDIEKYFSHFGTMDYYEDVLNVDPEAYRRMDSSGDRQKELDRVNGIIDQGAPEGYKFLKTPAAIKQEVKDFYEDPQVEQAKDDIAGMSRTQVPFAFFRRRLGGGSVQITDLNKWYDKYVPGAVRRIVFGPTVREWNTAVRVGLWPDAPRLRELLSDIIRDSSGGMSKEDLDWLRGGYPKALMPSKVSKKLFHAVTISTLGGNIPTGVKQLLDWSKFYSFWNLDPVRGTKYLVQGTSDFVKALLNKPTQKWLVEQQILHGQDAHAMEELFGMGMLTRGSMKHIEWADNMLRGVMYYATKRAHSAGQIPAGEVLRYGNAHQLGMAAADNIAMRFTPAVTPRAFRHSGMVGIGGRTLWHYTRFPVADLHFYREAIKKGNWAGLLSDALARAAVLGILISRGYSKEESAQLASGGPMGGTLANVAFTLNDLRKGKKAPTRYGKLVPFGLSPEGRAAIGAIPVVQAWGQGSAKRALEFGKFLRGPGRSLIPIPGVVDKVADILDTYKHGGMSMEGGAYAHLGEGPGKLREMMRKVVDFGPHRGGTPRGVGEEIKRKLFSFRSEADEAESTGLNEGAAQSIIVAKDRKKVVSGEMEPMEFARAHPEEARSLRGLMRQGAIDKYYQEQGKNTTGTTLSRSISNMSKSGKETALRAALPHASEETIQRLLNTGKVPRLQQWLIEKAQEEERQR